MARRFEEVAVDEQPSSSAGYEQEEAPTQALIVPGESVDAAMESLSKFFKDKEGGDNGENGDGDGDLKAVTVDGTACRYTGRRPHRDYTCGDVVE